jgi:hypothetical protein
MDPVKKTRDNSWIAGEFVEIRFALFQVGISSFLSLLRHIKKHGCVSS